MSTTVRRGVKATPDDVWAVLADGWTYAGWVVGASRIRAVDADWPDPGTRIHHSVGVWPLLIDDHTEALAAEPGRLLVLRARAWPIGEARVELRLEAAGVGATLVTMEEDVVAGPGRMLPRPARDVLIAQRNTEALRRLAHLAEGRTAPGLSA